jgi:uncharacterized protein with FMN-binding domain
MRRVLLALLGTAIGTTLLVGLKSQVAGNPLGVAATAPADPGDGSQTAAGSPGALTQPGAPAPSGAGASAPAGTGTAAGAAPQPTATAGGPGAPSGPAPTASTPVKTTAPPASRTILGPAVAAIWNGSNYGNMQVRITVTGTHIDDIVTVVQSNRPKTVSTTLRSQALTAQNSNVGNVSGATASSNAYKQSLQGAIAKI